MTGLAGSVTALALAAPKGPTESQDDGLLRAWEILEQVRIDADLVTLSACQSALGEEVAGEGLMGLTRAFQYAGARSVLASKGRMNRERGSGTLMLASCTSGVGTP